MHLTYRSRGSEYHGLLQRRTISSGVYWTTVIFTHPLGWGPRCSRLLLREDRLPVPRALLAFFLVQGIEAGIGPSFGLDGVVLGPGLGRDGVVLGLGLGPDGVVLVPGLGLDGVVLGPGLGLDGVVLGLGLGPDGVVVGPGLGSDGVVLLQRALGACLILDDLEQAQARIDLVLRLVVSDALDARLDRLGETLTGFGVMDVPGREGGRRAWDPCNSTGRLHFRLRRLRPPSSSHLNTTCSHGTIAARASGTDRPARDR